LKFFHLADEGDKGIYGLNPDVNGYQFFHFYLSFLPVLFASLFLCVAKDTPQKKVNKRGDIFFGASLLFHTVNSPHQGDHKHFSIDVEQKMRVERFNRDVSFAGLCWRSN
jgi:hypothetical protein